MKNAVLVILLLSIFHLKAQQTGDIRGFVYDVNTGDRISGAVVVNSQDKNVVVSDGDGYYSLVKLQAGTVLVKIWALEFDTIVTSIIVKEGGITKQDFYLSKMTMRGANIRVQRQQKVPVDPGHTEIQGRDIYHLPAIGGESDVLQYLQIMPGVVFSGDQGGQLYIRGGAPIMNKVMLDGMTIYNPFHSIGLFSVFETDMISSADVYSAGFGSEYGGRVSAVVDVKTRDGNKTRFAGKAGVNTFSSKLLLEGPIKRFSKGQSNSSFAVSYRNSYLKQSSKLFYNYADPARLPYNFGDLFVKFSINSSNGGYGKLYGFRFTDDVNFPGSTHYSWNSYGFGGKFLVVPDQAKTKVDGFFLYSKYEIKQQEKDNKPRSSGISGFNMGMNFTYNLKKDEFKWGMEINGFQTDFVLYNSNDRLIQQFESTTELNGFGNYKLNLKHFKAVIGARYQYYASLGNGSLEPRLQLRYSPMSILGFKFSSGIYSQNLMSAISDRDVVNLFYGFLSGPDNLPSSFNNKPVTYRIQKARHLTAGADLTLKKHFFNLEGFIKSFDQITNINRDKLFDDNEKNQGKPARLRQDYIIETGNAYGGDFTYKYDFKPFYIWAVYSLTYVNRFDGVTTYQPVFDRRHNANLLISYNFDTAHPTEISARWNIGSGFPFTQTQGYFEKFNFQDGISTDYTSGNGALGVLYGGINQGRLPWYHRLDISIRRTWRMANHKELNMVFSITNVYNRKNIFYFDRITLKRVNQLPFLPAIGCTYSF
ncbi:MAG: TonB-dependent receptor [Bacteroidetes bacterium]|nr:TonB-dependent receptor [Bacteroidota bacterium]